MTQNDATVSAPLPVQSRGLQSVIKSYPRRWASDAAPQTEGAGEVARKEHGGGQRRKDRKNLRHQQPVCRPTAVRGTLSCDTYVRPGATRVLNWNELNSNSGYFQKALQRMSVEKCEKDPKRRNVMGEVSSNGVQETDTRVSAGTFR